MASNGVERPRAVLFDLDDTLAESFKPPAPEMIESLKKLLKLRPIAILTAAGFPRIEAQFLEHFSDHPNIADFYIFPNSAAECFRWDGSAWKREYDEELSEIERAMITNAIRESAAETGATTGTGFEPQIIDRGAQIAYAILGLEAPFEAKRSWDPDRKKRTLLQQAIMKRVPDFEIRIGGMTTIDITKKGVDKAYGVRWLSKYLEIPASEMLYIGDALYEGGNDAVVIPTGIQTRAVEDPTETLAVIADLLTSCA